MSHIIKIKTIKHLTHDVLRIEAEKPEGLNFTPGQAIDVAVNKPNWEKKKRSFTFTSLPEEDYLQFTIKTYPEHNGVTNQLLSLKPGDELILHDVFGSIDYKGEGIFVAGGAGITPFLAIFKELEKENKIGNNVLVFANKTKADIILEDKFKKLLGKNFINVLSAEEVEGYEHGYISEELLKSLGNENLKYYYLCGPKPMMKAMEEHFTNLGIKDSEIIKERF